MDVFLAPDNELPSVLADALAARPRALESAAARMTYALPCLLCTASLGGLAAARSLRRLQLACPSGLAFHATDGFSTTFLKGFGIAR
jgi:hypothetical protein